jgi:hypothetical protein
MASEAQVNYIMSLAEKRDMTQATPELQAWINTPLAVENATNAEVNLLLESLKQLPWKPKAKSDDELELESLENLTRPARYFIVDPTDGVEKFYRVNKPEAPSKWAGRTFIDVQASDYFYPVKDVKHKLAILKTIAVDPIMSMNEYGMRLGVCGNCGRTLTDRGSRLKGIGPICEGRLIEEGLIGQATDEQLEMLRRLGLKHDDNGEDDDGDGD